MGVSYQRGTPAHGSHEVSGFSVEGFEFRVYGFGFVTTGAQTLNSEPRTRQGGHGSPVHGAHAIGHVPTLTCGAVWKTRQKSALVCHVMPGYPGKM